MKSFIFALLPLVFACGPINIDTGSGVAPRDPIPQGTIKYTGSFVGQYGKDVQGVVSIYLGSCGGASCQWVVRITGLLTPQELPLLLIPTVNASVNPPQYSLRTYQGDQNYYFTASPTATWGDVRIRSQPALRDYGAATLNKVD